MEQDDRDRGDGARPPQKRVILLFKAKEEFECLPGYRKALSCTKEELSHIVGKYGFSKENELQCGLNGCNQWHQFGYVIETYAGLRTHCGQKCGKNEFDVVWDEVEAEMVRLEEAEARRRMLVDLATSRSEIASAVAQLEVDVTAAARRVGAVMAQIDAAPAIRQALDRCVRDGGQIRVEAHIDEEHRDAFGARREMETIATIKGVAVVGQHRRVFTNLRAVVSPLMAKLDHASLEAMDAHALKAAEQEVQTVRDVIASAGEFVNESRAFCDPDNLSQMLNLKRLIPSKFVNNKVDRILRRLGRER